MKIITLNRAKSITISFILSLLLSFLSSLVPLDKSLAIQSEKEHTAKLVEGAKKEGKVLLYLSANAKDATFIIRRFRQRYPFIKSEFYRSGFQKLAILTTEFFFPLH